jgi:hypothetical protein
MNVNKSYIAATTMVSDIEGDPIDMRGARERLGVEAEWTATASPTGTLKLQGSYDHDDAAAAAATWVDLASGSFATSPAGSAGSTSEAFRGILAPWVRVVYAAGSGGTGASLTVKIAHS